MRRKIIAIIIGFLVSILLGFSSIIWGNTFSLIADFLSNDLTKQIFKDGIASNTTIHNYFFFYLIGLSVALGMTVTFIIWDIRDSSRRRLLIYIPFLLLILGFTVYNYVHMDYLIEPDVQVIFNLLLIFLGLVFVIKIWKLNTHDTDGIVLKYLIVFLISLCAVVIPFYFSIDWFFRRIGITSINLGFDMPIITTVSGLISTVVTVLIYLDDRKKKLKKK